MPADFVGDIVRTWAATAFLAVLGYVWATGAFKLFLNPRHLTESLGIDAHKTEGWVELRSIYGGSMLGFGLLVFAAAVYRPWRNPAFVGIIALDIVAAIVRVYALQVEAKANGTTPKALLSPSVRFYLIFEVFVTVASFAFLLSHQY